MGKLNVEKIVNGLETMTIILGGANELKNMYYKLFEIDKDENDERKEARKCKNENNAKERGRERRIYELIKEKNNLNIEEKDGRKIHINTDVLLLTPIVPTFVAYKVAEGGYKYIKRELVLKDKYKEFKRIFEECGIKEKMMNDVDYIPNEEELMKIQKIYKLETGEELLNVLRVVFK